MKMPRLRRTNYFRALVFLIPGLLAIGIVVFADRVDDVLCRYLAVAGVCGSLLPNWFYLALAAVAAVSVVLTSWALYKDHVRGDYDWDLVAGVDRYRD